MKAINFVGALSPTNFPTNK